MEIEAKTKQDLSRECVTLAKSIEALRGERLNETGQRCIDIAMLCVDAAAEDAFAQGERGKLASLEYLREARQWIKQALDADQKQADQQIAEVRRQLGQRREASQAADQLQ